VIGDNEEIIYGYHACLAVAKNRPESVVKLSLIRERLKDFSNLTKLMARSKRAYNVLSSDEISKMTSTPHHGGVTLIARKRPTLSLQSWIDSISGRSDLLAVALVGVSNPHNFGAIARSMAHFGVLDLILVDPAPGLLSAAAYRVSEGALESLTIVTTQSMDFLRVKGFSLYAPSPHEGVELKRFKPGRRAILMFGSEEHGLAAEFLQLAESLVRIPGSGDVESLNVSVAAGIFLYHCTRRFD
jgi:TrmH RNA methyltransferase